MCSSEWLIPPSHQFKGEPLLRSTRRIVARGASDHAFDEFRTLVASTRSRGGPSVVCKAIGVEAEAVADIGFVGVECIRVDWTGLFAPSVSGPLSVVIPVLDGSWRDFVIGTAELIDFVAFRVGDSSQWWLRAGVANVLGQHNVDWARAARAPLNLVATPFDWLRAGCSGAVVLDRSSIPTTLSGLLAVETGHDLGLAQKVHAALNAPHLGVPQVLTGRRRRA